MKRFLNIAAIAAVAMMCCACNEEVIEPDSDDWKDVPTEEELTDCIYFEDGSFTTSTVDFTLSNTNFTYTVLRKSENGLECTADIRPLTDEELAAEGNYYVRMPAEYYEVTPSVEFTDNDEADVQIAFKTEKASEVEKFITSNRNSDKTPCIAIKLDVTGDTGIKADRKSGFLIISWSYEDAAFCRLSVTDEGAESPRYFDIVPYTDLPSISVNHISSLYKVNVSLSSGNIVNEVKVNASFDEETAREYAEIYGYEPLPSDALTSNGEIALTPESTTGALTFSIDKSKLTGYGMYIAAVTAEVISDNAEIEGNSTFWFLVESPVSYDGLWVDNGSGGIMVADNEGWDNYLKNNIYAPGTMEDDQGSYLGGLFDQQQWQWHSSTDPYYINEKYGHFVQLKLTAPVSHAIKFNYWIRKMEWETPEFYSPSKIIVWYSTVENINNETSDTDGNWQELVTLTREADGLPYQNWGDMYSSDKISLEGKGKITYLRFSFMEKIADGKTYYLGKEMEDEEEDKENKARAYVAISEMKVWGN